MTEPHRWSRSPSGTIWEWRSVEVSLHVHPDSNLADYFTVWKVRWFRSERRAVELFRGRLPETVDLSSDAEIFRAVGLCLFEVAEDIGDPAPPAPPASPGGP